MTKLSLALAAAILIGCGSEGAKAADEAPLEVQVRSGAVIITSLEDGLRIYGLIVNRGNCPAFWNKTSKDNKYYFRFIARKDKYSVVVNDAKKLETIETLAIPDFYDKYGKDNALELNFGEKSGISVNCDPLEAEIETNKGTWSFSFR
jgi:lipoprotein